MIPTVKQKANKKLRARTKAAPGMNEFESERRRAAEELKRRLESQVLYCYFAIFYIIKR